MEESKPNSPDDIQIVMGEQRYWIGYLQVNIRQYRMGILFTKKWLKWAFPYMFAATRELEAERYNNPVQKEWTEMMWYDSDHTDFVISRGFLKPDKNERNAE